MSNTEKSRVVATIEATEIPDGESEERYIEAFSSRPTS